MATPALPHTFQDTVRGYANTVLIPIGKALGQWVDPNKLTVLSIVPFLIASWLIIDGQLFWAGVTLVIGAPLDALDGAVARATNKVTKFGALLDSVMDRISDGVIISALAAYFVTINDPLYMGVTMLAVIASLVTSYVRARALPFGVDVKVGVLDRLLRLIIIVVGLLLQQPIPLAIALMILGWYTVWQRIRFAMRNIEEDEQS